MESSYPEYKPFDNSPMKALKALLCILDYRTEKLSLKYQTNEVNNIKGYSVTFIQKVLKSINTLIAVIDTHKDYVTANTIIRMLIDNVSIFKLIYGCTDENEQSLRHYLYVKDGIKSRLKQLIEPIHKDKNITEEDFTKLKNQIESAKDSDIYALNTIESILEKHPYKTKNEVAFKNIISQDNWKYKSLTINQKNRYSWAELYKLLDVTNRSASLFSSHFSQFTHGLSISNIAIDSTDKNFELLIATTLMLTGSLQDSIDLFFENDINHIDNEYPNSKQFQESLSYFSDDYKNLLAKIASN